MLRALLLSGVVLSLGCGGSSTPGPVDGGGTDSGGSDAATADGGPVDGSTLDSSSGDAARMDSATMDSATMDSATMDSATMDAATTDAATDAGAADAGDDASITWPVGCGSPAPEWSDLTVGEPGTCPAFTACGGDIVGAWDLSGGCFEVAINDAISMCPGAMVTREEGRGRGCVDFGADGIGHRVAESRVDIDLFVPALCASFVSCSTIESQIRARGLDASCPADATGNCNCTAHYNTSIDDTDGYTTSGNEIIGTVSGKHWEYCVSGSQLNYRDTSPSGAREPGIIELSQR